MFAKLTRSELEILALNLEYTFADAKTAGLSTTSPLYIEIDQLIVEIDNTLTDKWIDAMGANNWTDVFE